MGVRQPLRGNPEQKNIYLIPEFSGGVNITFSDDLIPTNELRFLSNFDLDIRGELRARKGFGSNTGLTELYGEAASFPDIYDEATSVKQVLLFKLLENTENSWKHLADSKDLTTFAKDYCIHDQTIKTLMIVEEGDGDIVYYLHKFEIDVHANVTVTESTGTLPFEARVYNTLMNIPHGEQFGRIYFTSNQKGMVRFDNSDDTWHYIGDFGGGITNEAYKPHGVEVRKVGFNMLGDDPLTWIDSSGLSVESIQGVFLTTTDRIPLNSVPAGSKFHINIIYTGTYTEFEFDFYDFDVPLEAEYEKSNTYSQTGLAVYEVEFLTQPAEEVEMRITFTNEAVELEPYIDFYPIGEVDPKAKPIDRLNVGEFKMVQVYDRMLFYKGNEMWFSEVNRFDYVPNFNYILLPIDNSDEIMRIAYFRTGYIIFTRKKVFRLSGNFASTNLTLALVNDEIGCIAPNSVSLVDNELFFLSERGLRSLKSDIFRENMENVKEFDEKIYPLVPQSRDAYGFVYQDEYVLYSNHRGEAKEIEFAGRKYITPDVIRYYYKTNAYVIDYFPEDRYPRFLFIDAGTIYSIFDYQIFQYGTTYSDFDETYDLMLETAGNHLGYPLHEKKVKNAIFKTNGQTGLKQMEIEIYADGHMVHSELIEERISEIPIDLASSSFRLDKRRVPTRFKNIGFRLFTDSELGINLSSIGYIFKLGKVRE